MDDWRTFLDGGDQASPQVNSKNENKMNTPLKTKIFVGKLPPSCQEFELRKLFERYGEVTECSLMGSYAFVHMKSEEMAATAIENLNNYDIQGFKISVEQSTGERKGGGMRGGGMGRGGRGGFRGRGGGRGMGMGFRPSPYDRRPPMNDRFGPPGPMRNGYYDDYERRDRRPMPPSMDRRIPPSHMDRRLPPSMGRDGYRDPYERYDSYERMPPPPPMRRTPPMERRPPPIGYDRRDDPYMYPPRPEGGMYSRDPYAPRERSPRSPPRRYPGHAPRGEMPPRRF